MKRALMILFLTLAVSAARASDLPEAAAFYTRKYVTNFSGLYTNVVVGTNYIEDGLYHTFYINTQTNLNGASFVISFSCDKTNWIPAGTLSTAATGSSALMSNFVSKQEYYIVSVTGTNVATTITYLGGR